MAEKYTFVISDQSVNQYGFRILTAGINLERYKKNPVVLFMHKKTNSYSEAIMMPIGLASNLRVDGDQLLADIEFDDEDDLAIKVEKKVKKKMLRAVSMGIDDREWSEDPKLMIAGQTRPTLTKCELMEISIADIPNNGNCVKLYSEHEDENEPLLINLDGRKSTDIDDILKSKFSITKNKGQMNLTAIFKAFNSIQLDKAPVVNLSAGSTDDESLAEIHQGVTQLGSKIIELNTELADTKTQLTAKEDELKKLQDDAVVEKATNLVELALSQKKIVASEKDSYIALATSNYEETKKILDARQGYTPATEQINKEKQDSETNKKVMELSWSEADEQEKLEYLKANHFDHFKSLYKQEFGVEYKESES